MTAWSSPSGELFLGGYSLIQHKQLALAKTSLKHIRQLVRLVLKLGRGRRPQRFIKEL